jgi:hypothetical protein
MMKIIKLLIPILMSSFTLNATAKNQSPRTKEVQQTRLSEVINIPASKLWEIVGPGFADAHVWSTAIDHSLGKGAGKFEGATCSERYCEVNASGFDKIQESLTSYDAKAQTFSYNAHTGLPSFVSFAENLWEVVDLGNGKSQIKMTITMRMKPFMGFLMGGMFRRNLNKTLSSVMQDLKIYAETGEISAAKKARMAYMAKKQAA